MARQEVNLYTLDFRQGQQPLSARRIVQYAAAVFVVLMLVEGLTMWRLSVNRDVLVQSQRQHSVIETRVVALKQNRPLSEKPKLEAEIGSLRDQVERREELRTIIGGQNLGNAAGFSAQLETMARQGVANVALSQFRLLNGGGYVEFDGETIEPEYVPLFLQNLRKEESFEAVGFGVVSIVRETDNARFLKFHVGKLKEESR